MARPRRGKAHRDSADYLIDYFLTGELPEDDENAFAVLSLSDAELAQLWASNREAVMRAWSHPGCRPWGWWRYAAPAEPRPHLSGPGVPRHQRLNYAPTYAYGIPAWFGDPTAPPAFESQYDYLRRHGLLLKGEQRGPELQPDPPSIEDAARWEEIHALLAAERPHQ